MGAEVVLKTTATQIKKNILGEMIGGMVRGYYALSWSLDIFVRSQRGRIRGVHRWRVVDSNPAEGSRDPKKLDL